MPTTGKPGLCRAWGRGVAGLVLALWALLGAGGGWAQPAITGSGFPKRPFLAVDTAPHTGRGGALVLMPDHQRAISVGFDSTLRIWDIASGELVQRFFLPRTSPIGPRLMGVAVSPDGQRAVVGGFDFRRSLAIVSLGTGRIERMIRTDVDPYVVDWSPDGKHIALGSSRWNNPRGVRVYDAATGREVMRDVDFVGDIPSLQFRADGAFFAAAWEGTSTTRIKVYRPEGGTFRIAREATPRWGEFRMGWDATGKTLLVGSSQRLDGETLADLPYNLDRRNLPPGVGMARVRQMPDGRFIGVTFARTLDVGYLRFWPNERYTSGYTEHKLPDPQIRDLLITRNGEIVYMTEEGVVARVGQDGKLAWRVAPDIADFHNRPQALKASESGQVALPVRTEQGERELTFDLAQPGFSTRPAPDWRAPVTVTTRMRVLAWEGSNVGTVNGVSLPFQNPGERSVCLAVHTADPALVMGTNWQSLVKVSDTGKVLWRRLIGNNVTAVNIIESRGLVVAATASGMLRVFRWSDGAPVISYYVQPQARRWLAITNDGYYEAGTGAEDIAGWVVNSESLRVADFLPMSRFRNRLLMPGLGRKAWETGHEGEAVKALLAQRPGSSAAAMPGPPVPKPAPPPVVAPAPAAPPPEPVVAPAATEAPVAPQMAIAEPTAVRLDEIPPRVEIISPGFLVSTDVRQLRIRVRTATPPGAPVTQLRTMVASVTVASRALAPAAQQSADDERELTVEVPPEDSEIRLIAENKFGASVPTVIRVTWTGAKQQAGKGNLYVLAAGVSKYDNPDYNLGLAAKDARDFVATLMRQKGALYNDVIVQELLDKDASKDQVERGFEWLKQRMTARDTAIVFFAGHGLNEGSTYYFITRDADVKRLEQTAVPFDRIRAGLVSLPGRALIFVDTCHSGNVIGKVAAGAGRDNTAAINNLASSENGLVVFASSTGAQESQERPEWGNGAFTKAVVEGLLGAADFKKRGRITYKGLDAYVSDRVEELTKGMQTPVTPVLQGVPDFAIAEVRRP
jgi:hypothetical protein